MAVHENNRGIVRPFLSGIGLLAGGFGVWRTAPALMLLSVIPALVVAVFFLAGVIALGVNLESIVVAITPFTTGWDEPFATAFKILVGVALLIVAVLLLINTFTAITLIVGQPFYQRIWQHVENRAGGVPDAPDVPFLVGMRRGITDGVRMLVPTLLVGAGLLALGFVPIAGTALSAVCGAFLGGWFLAIELTGPAFESRGKTLTERRRALRAHRPMVAGFGLASYLVFLIPLGAVLMMPVAVAGAATLSRIVLNESAAAPTAPAPTSS